MTDCRRFLVGGHCEQPPRGLAIPFEILERDGKCERAFETRQRGEREHRQIHAIEPRGRDERDRDEQHAPHREMCQRAPHRVLPACERCHPHLPSHQLAMARGDARRVRGRASARQQISESLKTIRDQHAQFAACLDEAATRDATGALRKQRQSDADREHKREDDECERGRKRGEEHSHRDGNYQRDERRREESSVEILQRLDVADQTAQQIGGVSRHCHQACGGKRFDGRVEPDAQPREQTKSDIVRDVAFEITKQSARDAEKAYADDCHGEIGNRRMPRRARDDVRCRRHQPDAAANRERTEQHGEREEPLERRDEGEKAQQRKTRDVKRGRRSVRRGR